jgi:hypothetical protein
VGGWRVFVNDEGTRTFLALAATAAAAAAPDQQIPVPCPLVSLIRRVDRALLTLGLPAYYRVRGRGGREMGDS